MLEKLVLHNFKSYPGTVEVGPFKNFSCVIGPNGAGKSNTLDAIAFVLGVRSAQLRSSQLKDLIYRRGKKDRELGEEGGEEADGPDGEDEAEGSGPKKAWVMAVYTDKDGVEHNFQRTVTSAGSSEYKINGQAMNFAKYAQALEEHNINVKAKNFLVFQGDVEAVASQSPKDLSRLIDQISGSLELKEEYEKAKEAMEKATENSTHNFNKRRGINSEIKQFKEQKAEAQKFEKMLGEKDAAIVHHALWKLFHIQDGIDSAGRNIESKNEELRDFREEQEEHQLKVDAAKKEQGKAQRNVLKQEKTVKRKEKELDEKKPGLVAIDTKISHTSKKLKDNEALLKRVKKDHDAKTTELHSFQKQLDEVTKAVQKHEESQRKVSQAAGLTLSDDDLHEYQNLKAQANKKAVSERQSRDSLVREAKTKKDQLADCRDKIDQAKYKEGKLKGEEQSLEEKKGTVDAKVSQLQRDLSQAKKTLSEAEAERARRNQMETELNEKLRDCWEKLLQTDADRRESEREVKLKETLTSLQRIFPGVRGRVVELCKPSQRKYDTAVSTILGRHIDSVVVDLEKTAIDCIQYMRDQRSGQATFLPLETIQAHPINDRSRNLPRGARLAIDVITFDPSVERAMLHACGTAVVCDTLEIARHICYEKGQEVKAVTLDGTIIHRSGLITGGTSGAGPGRKWEEHEVQGLRRTDEQLRASLKALQSEKQNDKRDEVAGSIPRLETDLQAAKDDQSATNSRLKSVKEELKHLRKELKELTQKSTTTSSLAEELDGKIEELSSVIDAEESTIFSAFCRKIGVKDIREYEEKQLKVAQELSNARYTHQNQIARLNTQISFESDGIKEMDKRLETITISTDRERAGLETYEKEKESLRTEIAEIEEEIEGLRVTLTELNEVYDAATAALEEVKKAASKSNKVVDKAWKEIAAWNDEIEKLSSERFALYRRCKLEDIDLPLSVGSLDDVPIEEALTEAQPMDVDGDEDATQKVAPVKNYGVEVNFEDLEDDEREDGGSEMEQTLLAAVTKLTAEIERMTPNMKAMERLDDVQSKLDETDREFEKARKEAKTAKDRFNEVKAKRCELFNKAYTHISERIDEVYKDLTKGKASPMGGVAYLSLEDQEEPYLHGIKYHAMPPMKRFRDMEQLSGGEKTMAALALLFAIHSYHPSPFFVLDEVDAALDNTNVGRIANYVRSRAGPQFQFVVISLKGSFYEKASGLVGVWRDKRVGGSRVLTLDLDKYEE